MGDANVGLMNSSETDGTTSFDATLNAAANRSRESTLKFEAFRTHVIDVFSKVFPYGEEGTHVASELKKALDHAFAAGRDVGEASEMVLVISAQMNELTKTAARDAEIREAREKRDQEDEIRAREGAERDREHLALQRRNVEANESIAKAIETLATAQR